MAACRNPEHKPFWVVLQRKCNHSAFNGYRRTPSEYSDIACEADRCIARWRTKAAYVSELPDWNGESRWT